MNSSKKLVALVRGLLDADPHAVEDAARNSARSRGDRQDDAKQDAIEVLQTLREREREALVQFFLREKTGAEICSAFGFSDEEFQELRMKVKARFLARRKSRRRVASAGL